MSELYQHDPFLWLQAFLWRDAFWWDGIWIAATLLCTGWGMTALALLFVYRRTRRWRGLVRRTVPAFASLLLAGAAVQTLKAVLRAPRPLTLLEPGTFHVLLESLRLRSFPSGHSASAAALATWAVLRYGRSAWWLVVLAILGGLSRVYVGAHWTYDVIAGWTVGALAAVVVRAFELAIGRRLRARAPTLSGGAAPPELEARSRDRSG